MNTPQLSKELAYRTLQQVIDPEIGCNIVDLGLVYDVFINGGEVRVVMTLTTRGCPMHETIAWGVKTALLGLEEVTSAEVDIVWDPPWTPEMMTVAGKGFIGVA